MATGEFGVERLRQNQLVAVNGLCTDFGIGTAVAGAATVNSYIGKVTSESLTTAAGAEYTLTLTNNKIAAGDIVFVSVDKLTSAGVPGVGSSTVTAGQVVITVTNLDAAAFNAAIQINFMVVKAVPAL